MFYLLRNTLLLALGVLVISVGVTGGKADALSGSSFNPENIISDSVFYNSNALTATQVQNFLNSKVPSCDTNGTLQKSYYYNSSTGRVSSSSFSGATYVTTSRATYGSRYGSYYKVTYSIAPYTCLKSYHQDTPSVAAESGICGYLPARTGRSAANIIMDVSTACGISPKVLIVLLQKEQGLVTDDWPWKNQYLKATGYACPDTPSGCNTAYYGFFNQVYKAAWQYKMYRANPDQYNFGAGRTHNYVHFQADNPNTAVNEYVSCGYTDLNIRNQATAGLYDYTPYQPNKAALDNLYGTGDGCSAYGNRNFWRLFNDWFSGTQNVVYDCNSKVSNVNCVYSITKTDGALFLTTSKTERDNVINTYGWVYEGIAFYGAQTQQQGTSPVYRLRNGGTYYYTADSTERNNLLGTGSWADEGIAFYAYPPATSDNISHLVYKLYNSSSNHYYWTVDSNQKQYLLGTGYTLQTSTFSGLSGMADVPLVSAGRDNVYRLRDNAGYFYTSSLQELEIAVGTGSIYEGVLTTSNAANSGTAAYHLQSGANHFYTTSVNEYNNAIKQYGMTDEGISFYLDSSSDQIYRLRSGSKYLYTGDIREVMAVSNTHGWGYEGIMFDKNIVPSPVYRFISKSNGSHYYTIELNNAAGITNNGWRYEQIAFGASTNSGLPVYRLVLHNKHLYTADASEVNVAISKYGYKYERVAFYVSQTTTSNPVYRLRTNYDYFYTSSSAEKDAAVSKYGYIYEGIAFYLP